LLGASNLLQRCFRDFQILVAGAGADADAADNLVLDDNGNPAPQVYQVAIGGTASFISMTGSKPPVGLPVVAAVIALQAMS